MAKFKELIPEDNFTEIHLSDLWRSLESAQVLLSAALPALKCPICESESFVIDRDFHRKSAPVIDFHGPRGLMARIETLTIHCDDCGHLLFFSEDELLKRAERMK